MFGGVGAFPSNLQGIRSGSGTGFTMRLQLLGGTRGRTPGFTARRCRLPLPLLFFSPTPPFSFLLLHEQWLGGSWMGFMTPAAKGAQLPERWPDLPPLLFSFISSSLSQMNG
jgi:hypothetical protein